MQKIVLYIVEGIELGKQAGAYPFRSSGVTGAGIRPARPRTRFELKHIQYRAYSLRS